MEINVIDFKDYVAGWLATSWDYPHNLNINNMKAALHNALSMIEDEQDGIVATTERFQYYRENNLLTHEEQ